MNKSIFNTAVAVVVAAVFCVGCGGGGSSKPASLTGQWVEVTSYNTEMELFSDGTAVYKAKGLTISGKWSVVDKRFVVSVSAGVGPEVSEASDYKISGYELTLVDNNKDTSIYVRKEKLEEFKEKQAAEKATRIAATKREVEKTPTFTDSRDGKIYKRTAIGEQVWMSENLNYAEEGSKCYGSSDNNCAKYGRLYNWATALKACPAGFHLPSDDEWKTLENTVGGSSTAGTKLKSTSGWNNNGNGTDEFGFTALPVGGGDSGGSFDDTGIYGLWWSATEDDAKYAWSRHMTYNYAFVNRKAYNKTTVLLSVRCVQN